MKMLLSIGTGESRTLQLSGGVASEYYLHKRLIFCRSEPRTIKNVAAMYLAWFAVVCTDMSYPAPRGIPSRTSTTANHLLQHGPMARETLRGDASQRERRG